MKKLMFALATVVVAAGAFTSAQQGQRRAPDPRSMGGGDCRDNPYNCADAANQDDQQHHAENRNRDWKGGVHLYCFP